MSAGPRAYKTSAIVLRARNLGEADKIYTLFTLERGKVDAVGKGVRRANSRLAGKLEFMSETALTLHRGRNLDIITGAQIERARWAAIVAPAGFATAHVLAELVDAFCELDFAMPEIYALLRGALQALAANVSGQRLTDDCPKDPVEMESRESRALCDLVQVQRLVEVRPNVGGDFGQAGRDTVPLHERHAFAVYPSGPVRRYPVLAVSLSKVELMLAGTPPVLDASLRA